MSCHFCQAEAVTRCYNCGELVCEAHSKNEVCPHCTGGFVAGDPRPDRVSVKPLPKEENHGWWRPQQAEEYVPPACYECKSLTRAVCRNCQSHYCAEHAGPTGLCAACGRSANLGLYVLAGIFVLFMLTFAFQWWYRP
jgi:hypothetical protein